MKNIKIGKLIFNQKSLFLILLCLFTHGLVVGISAVSNQINGYSILITFFMVMPYLLFYKSISKNVEEVK